MDKFMIDPKEENRPIYREPSEFIREVEPVIHLSHKSTDEFGISNEQLYKETDLPTYANYSGYLFIIWPLIVVIAILFFIYYYLYGKKSSYLFDENAQNFETSLEEFKQDVKEFIRDTIEKIDEWKTYFISFYDKFVLSTYVEKDTLKTVRYKI